MKLINGIIGAAGGLALVVFLLLQSVQIPALGLWFYRQEFDKNGTYAAMGMEENALDAVARGMINYLNGSDETLSDDVAVVRGTERLFFNEKEISHMIDVELLFAWGLTIKNIALFALLASLVYFILTHLLLKSCSLRTMFGWWRGFSAGTLALLAALGIIIALNFQRAFTIFHEIFFNNDLWLLNPRTDLLINMLPNQFFQDIAVFIGGCFLAGLVLVIILSSVLRGVFKRNGR
ncbi:MAG: TIGR01906 family membrane protein [Clostridiales bacterium]|jgi:integral membrane protein (TIGR01906 family)|nr:TIGR01906 family membrane protein [Clostridiales bacterium]